MELIKAKTVAFSGYRYSKLIKSFDNNSDLENLKQSILRSVIELHIKGYTTFLCGMSDGFDLMCAMAVLKLKYKGLNIDLVAVIPFKGHSVSDKDIYKKVIDNASEVIYLSEQFKGNYLYLQRNDFMLEHSAALLCYYDGLKGGTAYTFNKACRLGLEIVNICLYKSLAEQLSLGI